MARLSRRQLAFITYDPYSSSRIDPRDGSDLFQYPELPSCIHDAVARAKKLVGPLTQAELTTQAAMLDRPTQEVHWLAMEPQDAADQRDNAPSDEPDCLNAYLKHSAHQIPAEKWPRLFGLLALSLAGELYNELWPSEQYLAETSIERIDGLDTAEQTHTGALLELAIQAVRAAGFGEGFRAGLYEHKLRESNRKKASTSHKNKEPLFQAYITWAMDLPEDHPYRSQRDAERHFLYQLKQKNPDLYAYRTENSYLTMRKRLKTYCKEQGIAYPFG